MKRLNQLNEIDSKFRREYVSRRYSEKAETVRSFENLFLKIEVFRLYEGVETLRIYIVKDCGQFEIFNHKQGREDQGDLTNFIIEKCEQFRDFYFNY